ncbi:S24 family peptidase [Gluconobacter cerinus]|uniref:S24 family peptidase n=1 Tax=Gluconobacter cerinus TaxID=38307 RepID=UPI001B8C8113|nr:S24 family peptidase [Gluconobacter cerinus]MBS1042050.1 S24 family peptidase [Gluconobacter cerinus]MBS1048656.1 S24 family peptidase [Gluconobacter cerinus]
MHGPLSDGDRILVNTQRQPIVSGSVYAIRAYNEVLVKRLNRHIDGNIEAASDNPRFKLHIIKAEAAR